MSSGFSFKGIQVDTGADGPPDAVPKRVEESCLLTFCDIAQPVSSTKQGSALSVAKRTASAYLCCGCYNVFGGASWNEIKLRRDQWLGLMHTLCFAVHLTFAIMSFSAGYGKPMEVSIFRVRPEWNNTGRNGYDFVVERDFDVRIDTVTCMFFLLSAFFHSIWVICFICSASAWNWLLGYIDLCFCWWYAAVGQTLTARPAHCT